MNKRVSHSDESASQFSLFKKEEGVVFVGAFSGTGSISNGIYVRFTRSLRGTGTVSSTGGFIHGHIVLPFLDHKHADG